MVLNCESGGLIARNIHSNDFSGKIKFWHGSKDYHTSIYDEFGVGAVAGIDNLFNIGPKVLPPEVIKKMKTALEYWNSVK